MMAQIRFKAWKRTVLAVLALMMLGCNRPPEPEAVDIVAALSKDPEAGCYKRADQPAALNFPRDLGPHEDFRTEWWYYTGNLSTSQGREFGFQLTFFRQALDCEAPQGNSAWRTRQLYFAHFAVTDIENQRFYSAQRMNRGSLDLAGARDAPFKVWIDDWSSARTGPGAQGLRLRAGQGIAAKGETTPVPVGLDLFLDPDKPLIRQGNQGWSRKGPGPWDASYYYSFPGLKAQGRLRLGETSFEVTGRAWFDHEWSTSALGENVQGWDWFALHLTKGALAGIDLMVCQVRQRDGRPNGFGFGSISFGDGRVLILSQDDFSILPQAHWTSPSTQRRYPVRWTLAVPRLGLELAVAARVLDQEHPHGFTYYEGAVEARGGQGSGRGYVEMTGY